MNTLVMHNTYPQAPYEIIQKDHNHRHPADIIQGSGTFTFINNLLYVKLGKCKVIIERFKTSKALSYRDHNDFTHCCSPNAIKNREIAVLEFLPYHDQLRNRFYHLSAVKKIKSKIA